jgi:hypothetical protein
MASRHCVNITFQLIDCICLLWINCNKFEKKLLSKINLCLLINVYEDNEIFLIINMIPICKPLYKKNFDVFCWKCLRRSK